MEIISHRGLWLELTEKNRLSSFHRSFQMGFGTETDVRDRQETLVIAHDLAKGEDILFTEFIELYRSYDSALPLALNIKSDGLQDLLKNDLNHYGVKNYFVFDMSVPDSIGYLKRGMNIFSRQSEYEQIPSFYEEAVGIWMDEFLQHWINEEQIEKHLLAKKRICIVSPELHGRSYQEEWAHYKYIDEKLGTDMIMLCTDLPEEAKIFFNS